MLCLLFFLFFLSFFLKHKSLDFKPFCGFVRVCFSPFSNPSISFCHINTNYLLKIKHTISSVLLSSIKFRKSLLTNFNRSSKCKHFRSPAPISLPIFLALTVLPFTTPRILIIFFPGSSFPVVTIISDFLFFYWFLIFLTFYFFNIIFFFIEKNKNSNDKNRNSVN